MLKLLKLLTGQPLHVTKYPSVTLTGAIQLDCTLVFPLCGGFCFSGCMLCMVCQQRWLLSQCLSLLKKKCANTTNLVFSLQVIISWFIRKYEPHIVHAHKYLFLFYASCILASKAQALVEWSSHSCHPVGFRATSAAPSALLRASLSVGDLEPTSSV